MDANERRKVEEFLNKRDWIKPVAPIIEKGIFLNLNFFIIDLVEEKRRRRRIILLEKRLGKEDLEEEDKEILDLSIEIRLLDLISHISRLTSNNA